MPNLPLRRIIDSKTNICVWQQHTTSAKVNNICANFNRANAKTISGGSLTRYFVEPTDAL